MAVTKASRDWRLGKVAIGIAATQALLPTAAALAELDSVRNNLSLPQIGLSLLTSIAAVAGAILKGELRAESSHKEVLLLAHALASATNEGFNKPSAISTDSTLWKFAVWLEQKGHKVFKEWCQTSDIMVTDACILVETHAPIFFQSIILSWYWLTCSYRLKRVAITHGECPRCLETAANSWSGVLDQCVPSSWLPDVEVKNEVVLFKCASHGGRSLLSQANMMPPVGARRLGILLPQCRDDSDSEKNCLPKAFCSLDSVERNMQPDIARLLLGDGELHGELGEDMSWAVPRKFVALFVEIGTSIGLSWAAQMPPLSASLVGRRLVRSYITGARGNSTLIATLGNIAHVYIAEERICLVDISTSVAKHRMFSLMSTFEIFLPLVGLVAQYACWLSVLIGWLPPVFGTAPNGKAGLLKTCIASATLAMCCYMCVFKNLAWRTIFIGSRTKAAQSLWILGWHLVSQVVLWVLHIYVTKERMHVACVALVCAGFGEIMWLAAMWKGAHHMTMPHRVAWDRTLAHVAPYFTDVVSTLVLAL